MLEVNSLVNSKLSIIVECYARLNETICVSSYGQSSLFSCLIDSTACNLSDRLVTVAILPCQSDCWLCRNNRIVNLHQQSLNVSFINLCDVNSCSWQSDRLSNYLNSNNIRFSCTNLSPEFNSTRGLCLKDIWAFNSSVGRTVCFLNVQNLTLLEEDCVNTLRHVNTSKSNSRSISKVAFHFLLNLYVINLGH